MMTAVRALLLGVALLSGCSTPAPSTRDPAPPEARGSAAPARPANRNLSGFSVAFRQGYVEGCESVKSGARSRDEGRYKSDMDYALGWNDGYSICRR